MSTTAGRGLFDILIAEMERDLDLLPEGTVHDELAQALVGLRRKRDSFPLGDCGSESPLE
jgi:hypothetical protein